jgi:hypothetical protein
MASHGEQPGLRKKFQLVTPEPITIGGSGSAGELLIAARGDHEHALDVFPTAAIRMTYQTTTDLFSGTLVTAAGGWVDLIGDQGFSVSSPSSLVEIAVRGMAAMGAPPATTGQVASRLVIDSGGTPITEELGSDVSSSSSGYAAPLAGGNMVRLTGLAAGAHTVKIQVKTTNDTNLYLRSATLPDSEFLVVNVTEFLAS